MSATEPKRPKLHPDAPQNINWVRVDQIMEAYSIDFCKQFKDAADYDWEDKRYYMQHLRDSIERDGIIDPVYYLPPGHPSIDWQKEHGYAELPECGLLDYGYFGNGHHRLTALIDLGYDEIPTTDDHHIEWNERARAAGLYSRDD